MKYETANIVVTIAWRLSVVFALTMLTIKEIWF